MGGGIMKLYEIINGYMRQDYVHVLVIAKDVMEAFDKAKELLKKEAENDKYPEDYWKGVTAQCLCDDVSKGYVSEIRGG